DIRFSDCGDWVRISVADCDRALSLMAGVFTSRAVSQRSSTSSTMRASGRLTAKDRARWWPNPVDRSRDLDGGDAGELRPEGVPEDGVDVGWMMAPLYSGGCGG